MLVISALIGALAASIYGWLVFRVWNTSESIEVLASTVDSSALEEERLRTTENLVERTEVERAKLRSLFVTEDSAVSFIETIEGLGETTDVSVTVASVDTADLSSKNAIGAVHIQFTTTGSWQNTVYFVTLLDTIPFVTDVLTAELARLVSSEGDEWRGVFSIRVGMIE